MAPRRTVLRIREVLLLLAFGVAALVITFSPANSFRPMGTAPPVQLQQGGELHGKEILSSTLIPPTTPCPASRAMLPKSFKIACVGDSITYGNGTHVKKKEREHEGSYPLELKFLLEHGIPGSSSGATVGCPKLERTILEDIRRQLQPSGGHDGCSRCDGIDKNSNGVVKYTVKNFGKSGRTASPKMRKFSIRHTAEFNASKAYQPQLVIILLGTNDSKKRHWEGAEGFKQYYRSLILLYVENYRLRMNRSGVGAGDGFPNLPLYVQLVLPPPATAAEGKEGVVMMIDGNVIAKEIVPAVKELSEELSQEHGGDGGSSLNVHVFREPVDLFTPFSKEIEGFTGVKKKTRQGGLSNHLLHDGVHPTVLGHQRIAEQVYRSLCL